MTVNGYSDTINHALAFAAKHHDRQVRKGTRLPYLTHPANVAVILTRYGRDTETVVAGILHDVIEDCVRDGYSREMLEQRIGGTARSMKDFAKSDSTRRLWPSSTELRASSRNSPADALSDRRGRSDAIGFPYILLEYVQEFRNDRFTLECYAQLAVDIHRRSRILSSSRQRNSDVGVL